MKKQLLIAAVAATMSVAATADISITGDAYTSFASQKTGHVGSNPEANANNDDQRVRLKIVGSAGDTKVTAVIRSGSETRVDSKPQEISGKGLHMDSLYLTTKIGPVDIKAGDYWGTVGLGARSMGAARKNALSLSTEVSGWTLGLVAANGSSVSESIAASIAAANIANLANIDAQTNLVDIKLIESLIKKAAADGGTTTTAAAAKIGSVEKIEKSILAVVRSVAITTATDAAATNTLIQIATAATATLATATTDAATADALNSLAADAAAAAADAVATADAALVAATTAADTASANAIGSFPGETTFIAEAVALAAKNEANIVALAAADALITVNTLAADAALAATTLATALATATTLATAADDAVNGDSTAAALATAIIEADTVTIADVITYADTAAVNAALVAATTAATTAAAAAAAAAFDAAAAAADAAANDNFIHITAAGKIGPVAVGLVHNPDNFTDITAQATFAGVSIAAELWDDKTNQSNDTALVRLSGKVSGIKWEIAQIENDKASQARLATPDIVDANGDVVVEAVEGRVIRNAYSTGKLAPLGSMLIGTGARGHTATAAADVSDFTKILGIALSTELAGNTVKVIYTQSTLDINSVNDDITGTELIITRPLGGATLTANIGKISGISNGTSRALGGIKGNATNTGLRLDVKF